MAGLCEGGSEPRGHLKASKTEDEDEAHVGLAGNELADHLAKQAASNNELPVSFDRIPVSDIMRELQEESVVKWENPPWPPRSPDLTALDFFLCGRMKSLVYETPVETAEDLVALVVVAAGEIADTPGVIERVYENIIRRYNACNEVGGRHIEPHL
ncbi:hypothetical protein ANN_20722 [Periplaneta americana]|uniref:RNase H type-1 domain-containing protein n=1 Tax=Periplaneta americana TaxID=6978 RepID=A0ABQ8SDR6_PERAM|nr:hypothetical protein ANN_20722 [Periplaneta americana]